jgi:ribose 5-phosphate isomerase A
LGCDAQLRTQPDSSAPFLTDNGNYIYHCKFPKIDDPAGLDRALKSRAGVVETGLFLGIASLALIATDHDVQQITGPA